MMKRLAMFKRDHHNRMMTVLSCLDGDLFRQASCAFAGSTAVILQLDEFREKSDIKIMSATQSGEALLRERLSTSGIEGLFWPDCMPKVAREVTSSMAGMRIAFFVDGEPIVLRIHREREIDLNAMMHPTFGLPLADHSYEVARRLVLNAYRWSDTSYESADIIDLAFMISRWGPVPDSVWHWLDQVGGSQILAAYANAIDLLRTPGRLETCMERLKIDPGLAPDILAALSSGASQHILRERFPRHFQSKR